MQAHAAPLYSRSPWYFSLLLLIAFGGFFPSYLARLGDVKALHHFHGLTAKLLLLHDRKLGKMRAPYLMLFALLLVQHASFSVSMQLAPWRAVVAWIQGW